MNFKTYLENLIASKQTRSKELRDAIKASQSVDEVRSMSAELEAVDQELRDAQAQLDALDASENHSADPEPATDPNEARGAVPDMADFNPLAAYSFTKSENRNEDVPKRATMEYRTAFMNYVQRGVVNKDVLEFRDNDSVEKSDLGVLMPITVVQQIIKDTEKVYGQLYSRVRKTNVKGGVKYPIGSFEATFRRIPEKGAPTDRQKGGEINDYVEFSTKLGEIRLAKTLLASVLEVPVFESELSKTIVEAYMKGMDSEILSGTGANNEMEGILTEAAKGSSGRIPSSNIITMSAADMADWKKWQTKLFAKIPLSMRALKPEFVMTADTYESNIKTLHDDNNRPLYNETFNPVDGAEIARFKGREVVFIEDGIGIHSFNDASAGDYVAMYWVPNKAYAINTNLEFAVKKYYDEEKLEWVTRAVVINDGKVLDPKYIWLIKKGA